MSVPEDTYKAKNMLITGGAGFIASHVAILFAKYPQYKCVKHAAAFLPPTPPDRDRGDDDAPDRCLLYTSPSPRDRG